MPVFKDYQEMPVEIEVSTKLFYQAMTSGEKQEMRRLLRTGIGSTTTHADFELSISRLSENYYSLTSEEIQTLANIASRFI